MFIHQTHNSLGKDVYNAFVYKNVRWQPHIHKGYEFVYVFKGSFHTVIDGKDYTVYENECLFIDSYLVHSYDNAQDCICLVVVFSPAFVESFTHAIAGKKPTSSKFALSPLAKNYIIEQLTDGDTAYENDATPMQKAVTLNTRAALQCICAEFFQSAEFTAVPPKEHSLALDCLLYIESHYDTDVTLAGMAKALGYDYEYLSRTLRRSLGIGFKTLVNQYRCEYAQSLIVSTDKSMAEIALQSGFQSIRSFNRAFKEITGTSPSDLRK